MAQRPEHGELQSYACVVMLAQVTTTPAEQRPALAHILFGHAKDCSGVFAATCARGDSHVAGVLVKVREEEVGIGVTVVDTVATKSDAKTDYSPCVFCNNVYDRPIGDRGICGRGDIASVCMLRKAPIPGKWLSHNQGSLRLTHAHHVSFLTSKSMCRCSFPARLRSSNLCTLPVEKAGRCLSWRCWTSARR